ATGIHASDSSTRARSGYAATASATMATYTASTNRVSATTAEAEDVVFMVHSRNALLLAP
ncbi:hypothetical protein E4U53_005049, partial [Claviceps sorghi]